MTHPARRFQSLLPRRHWARVVLAVTAFLPIVQFTTYFLFARATMPRDSLRQLSDYFILKRASLVVIDAQTWSTHTPDQQQTLKTEMHRYVPHIYSSMHDVPEQDLRFDPITDRDRQNFVAYRKLPDYPPALLEEKRRELEAGRTNQGLANGLCLKWRLNRSGLFWM